MPLFKAVSKLPPVRTCVACGAIEVNGHNETGMPYLINPMRITVIDGIELVVCQDPYICRLRWEKESA